MLNVQISSRDNIHAEVTQGFILGSLLFLNDINDWSDNLTSSAKLFADNASFVDHVNTSTNELNDDFEKLMIGLSNRKWVSIHFSRESKITDPPIFSFKQ